MASVSEVELKLYEIWVVTYRHHMDLVLKGLTVYLAIVGAVGGLIFGPERARSLRIVLLAFVLLVSALGVATLQLGHRWLRGFTEVVRAVSARVPMATLPLRPVAQFGYFLQILVALILIGSLLLLILEIVR
jgi:hypothetical protein